MPGPQRPGRLKEGDTVGIITPSWGGPHAFPRVYDLGIKNLEEVFDLRVKEFRTTRAHNRYLRAHPQARANDVNEAFSDPEIKAIIASVGGSDSIRILPYLDLDAIRSHPKIIMGFSDTTTILTWLNQQNLVTFYGPSVMAGFSQIRNLPLRETEHIREVLFSGKQVDYFAFRSWSEGYPEWKDDENLGKLNPSQAGRGWRWLQGEKKVVGRLFGGCFEVLEMMKGTRFWPGEGFWKGKILFLETSENVPGIEQVLCGLRSYGMLGALSSISALLIARMRGYPKPDKRKLERAVLHVVAEEFSRSDLPIIANMDFGHTDPQLILPLGGKVEVGPSERKISLIEPPVL